MSSALPPTAGGNSVDQSLRDLPFPSAPPLGGLLAGELAALKPVVPRRPLRDLARIAGVSIGYGAVLLALMGLRPDFDGLPGAWVAAIGLAWLAGFGALLWLAIVPRRGAVMPRWRAAGIGAAVASVLFVAAGFLVPVHGAGSVELDLARVHLGHGCLEYGVATALLPVVLGALVLRGAVPVGSRWVAAALGAAGGSFGGFVLHMHCPVSDSWHVGLIHGGVVIVSAVLAAVLAPRRLET